MTDFQVTTAVTGEKVDTRWRASKHGQDVARPGQLDMSLFKAGEHYNLDGATDNIIPSGVAVTALESGLYGPYTGAEGTTLDGYINDNAGVPVSPKATFARLVHGIVKPSMLPIPAQREAVKTATTTGSFIYVED